MVRKGHLERLLRKIGWRFVTGFVTGAGLLPLAISVVRDRIITASALVYVFKVSLIALAIDTICLLSMFNLL